MTVCAGGFAVCVAGGGGVTVVGDFAVAVVVFGRRVVRVDFDVVAVAAGGSLFGIAGAYLAVPMTAVVSAVYSSLAADEPRD